MFNKVYEKVKDLIKEYYKVFIIYIVLLLLITVKLPYIIDVPGGIINVNGRVQIETSNDINGTINYAYVSEIRATIPTLLISLFKKTWDVEEINSNALNDEEYKDILFRDKMYLKESISNATIVAYNKLGLDVKVISQKLIVVGDLNSNFKIGDEILKVNNIEVNSLEKFKEIINDKNINDIIDIEVINNNEKHIRKCKIYEEEGRKIVGVLLLEDKELECDPIIKVKTEKSESGSSGGLMLALTIYDKLSDEDIIKGLNIVGTGSIDNNGNVEEIGGIKYKLLGASKEKIDLFFVPINNYEEATKINEEYDLGFKIVPIKTFDELVEYLKTYRK